MSTELQLQVNSGLETKNIVNTKKERILYIDILRGVSILAVIIGHAAAIDVSKISGGAIDSSRWWIAHLIDTSVRWCIPVFFMISGILLLNTEKNESYSTFLKKRFSRIGIPFAIWSVFYSYAKHLIIEPDGTDLKSMPWVCLKDILSNTTYYHMWFMYTIVGIYLFIPVIRAALKKLTRNEVRIYLMLWFLVSIIYPTIQSIYNLVSDEWLDIQLFSTPYLTGYLGYFVLGYYIKGIELKKSHRAVVYIGGIAGFAAATVLVYLSNLGGDVLKEDFYSYFSLPVFMISIAFFVFMRQIDWEKRLGNMAKKAVVVLAEVSFGIYLVHMFFEDLFVSRIGILKYMPVGIRILIISVLTFILSLYAVRLFNPKKRLFKYLFG